MSARSLAARTLRKATSFAGSVVAVRTTAPEFVLTYDDGPRAGNTDRILAVLADRGATATFFMLLSRVRKDPGLVAAVAAAGHEIGFHGVDHRDVSRLPLDDVRRRMHDGRRELEDTAGRAVLWYRPPYGHQTFGTWRASRAAGLTPVLWGASTRDFLPELTQHQRVATALVGARAGTILLAHDNAADLDDGVDDGPASDLDRAELAGLVLDAYGALGLSARSLGDALVSGSPRLEGRFKH